MGFDRFYKGYVKPEDSWSTVLFADLFGIPLSKGLARLRIHPTLISFLSIIFLLSATYFFSQGNKLALIYGAMLWELYWILDCTDGKIARLTGKTTKFGAKLDKYMATLGKLIPFMGLIYGYFYLKGTSWFLIGLILFLWHYGIHILGHQIYRLPPDRGWPIPTEKRRIKRIAWYFDDNDEQFLMLFVSPLIGPLLWGLVVSILLYSIVVVRAIASGKFCPRKISLFEMIKNR